MRMVIRSGGKFMHYLLDPELAAIAPVLPVFDFSDVPGMRVLHSEMVASEPRYESKRPLSVADISIPGYQGAPDIKLRVYTPADRTGPVPGLLYLHGGAYVMGDLDSADNRSRLIVDQTGVAVVSVDYRLAPECPYPAALDDSYAALLWMAGEAGHDRGIDAARVGVWGESAGGGLAAALTLATRDRGGPALVAQFLDAPGVDDRLETHSMRNLFGTPFVDASVLPHVWKYYLGEAVQPGSADVPLYAAPGRAELSDLAGLPPAWVSAYQIDPMRDEVLNYAQLLTQAGVPTELHHYSGVFHVAHLVPGTTIGARMIAAQLDAIRRLLYKPSA
jgi:acetyl esterase